MKCNDPLPTLRFRSWHIISNYHNLDRSSPPRVDCTLNLLSVCRMCLSRQYFQFPLQVLAWDGRERPRLPFRPSHRRRRPFSALPSTVVHLKRSCVLGYDNARGAGSRLSPRCSKSTSQTSRFPAPFFQFRWPSSSWSPLSTRLFARSSLCHHFDLPLFRTAATAATSSHIFRRHTGPWPMSAGDGSQSSVSIYRGTSRRYRRPLHPPSFFVHFDQRRRSRRESGYEDDSDGFGSP